MKISRKQKFKQLTANESQAQRYYYKRIRIGSLLLCLLFLITCGTAVVLGLNSSKQDVAKLYDHTTYWTTETYMKTGPSNTVNSDIAFPKYDLPDFIATYAYNQTLSLTVKGRGKRLRVNPYAALFDSNMNFVSSNLRAWLSVSQANNKAGSAAKSQWVESVPIPFQTDKELIRFTGEINSAIADGSKVEAEGFRYEHILYPVSIIINGKDGIKKTIKISTDYDLPPGIPRETMICNEADNAVPLQNEAARLSSKYFNKNTIKNSESVKKELEAKSNIFKSYYMCVEKISLAPLGYSGANNISELYSDVLDFKADSFTYFKSDTFKTLPSEEYYIVSYGTYSPFWLAIKEVETYSSVNFLDMALIIFVGIFLWTVAMLTLLKKRLRQIEQNRKDLIMSIAHEMKTPFGIVRLYGEKILITPDPEAKEDFASDMMDEIDEMNSLLQNILDASRLDSGSLKLNKTQFVMNEAVEDVLEGYAPLAEDKNIKLTMNAADKFPVEADNYRIKQVISNLLSNAVKNTPENGKIDITIKKEGKNTAVTVKNTGKPIPKEKIHRIWDAFYKHSENADNSKSGAGLGLSIVKNIILLHGGFCGVENKADGVEFWFRI